MMCQDLPMPRAWAWQMSCIMHAGNSQTVSHALAVDSEPNPHWDVMNECGAERSSKTQGAKSSCFTYTTSLDFGALPSRPMFLVPPLIWARLASRHSLELSGAFQGNPHYPTAQETKCLACCGNMTLDRLRGREDNDRPRMRETRKHLQCEDR